jgi:hypothetical protein
MEVTMSELNFMPAHQLAAMIRQRQVSAVEVLDAHLAQIARHNPALNAIVTLDSKGARARAQAADAALSRGEVWGPLHGVPVTIKDAIATAGMRTTSGFPPCADLVPAEDAPVVARLRAAGAIILGKTKAFIPGQQHQPRADRLWARAGSRCLRQHTLRRAVQSFRPAIGFQIARDVSAERVA